jgi:hypothetical protein
LRARKNIYIRDKDWESNNTRDKERDVSGKKERDSEREG